MTHYVDWNILILKVPTAEHGRPHRKFSDKLVIRAAEMGLEEEFDNLGATTFKTLRVSKEGDSAFRPLSIRPRKGDWTAIVLESGWPESPTRLRRDAHIWLEESGGDVKIVLLFSIGRTARTMIIEKWENRPVPVNPSVPANPPVSANPPVPANPSIPANPPAPASKPATRSMMRAGAQTPTQIQAITIDSNPNAVTGARLTLEFRKIFLRQAVPPLDHDFTFTTQDLLAFATIFWRGVQ